MAITMTVLAPDVPQETVMELSSSLGKEFNTTVPTFDAYRLEGKTQTIWIEGILELFTKLDPLHFWAIVKLTLSPVMVTTSDTSINKVIDISLAWAVKHGTPGKKVKLLIYAPDSGLIKEIDA